MSKPADFARLMPPCWGPRPSEILRSGEGAYARSPYAAESNPWVAREEWETLLLLRGTIVASFGQVETTLSELAIRLSRDPICAALRKTYPHALGKRLSFLRACFGVEPYCRRNGLAAIFFQCFEDAAELRHIMAHGAVIGTVADWRVTFRDFRPGSDDEIRMRDHHYTFRDLERFAYDAARLSRRITRIAAQVRQSGWVPPLEHAE